MVLWMLLVGCGGSADVTAPDVKDEAAAPAKGKKGKGRKKGKGKKAATGKKPSADPAKCPDGVRVNDGWEGEYPDPMVDVTTAVAMQGRAAPCSRRPDVDCTVPKGLYHPWSALGGVTYKTVRADEVYTVLKDTTIGGVAASAGSEIVVVQYLAEGFCMIEVAGTVLEAMCPGVGDDGATFEKKAAVAFDTLQLVEVGCEGGDTRAWIDAAQLMKQEGVRPGTLVEFGKVGPGTD